MIKIMTNYCLKDLIHATKLYKAALYIAWGDLKARYKRSILGPLWMILSTAIGVAGLGVVWGNLLHLNMEEFIPSLTLGLATWQLISNSVTDGVTIFTKNSVYIKNTPLPYCFYPMLHIMKTIINFIHYFIVVIAVLIIYPKTLSLKAFIIIPNLIILTSNLFWISILLGLAGARFRDVEPLVQSMMPIIFFLSPIIYRPTSKTLSDMDMITLFNPFSYFISLLREPMLGIIPDRRIYAFTILTLISGCFFTYIITSRTYKKISFWI